MVLPDRIELSTSPLPMECSTTELRQHAPDHRIGRKGLHKAADPCHKAGGHASAGRAAITAGRRNLRESIAHSRFRFDAAAGDDGTGRNTNEVARASGSTMKDDRNQGGQ